MPDLAELLAVIGDYEMQRRALIESNEKLAGIARSLASGELKPEQVDPDTLAITKPPKPGAIAP